MTYMQWHERNLAKWNEKYGKPKPLTPLWMQQDSFPDWLKAKRIKTPQDAERTLKWLRKEDMSRELQWIDKDKGIPTAWYWQSRMGFDVFIERFVEAWTGVIIPLSEPR